MCVCVCVCARTHAREDMKWALDKDGSVEQNEFPELFIAEPDLHPRLVMPDMPEGWVGGNGI